MLKEGKYIITLKTPIKKEDILNLKVGDEVLINGNIFSGRDRAHQYLIENNFEKIKRSVIYHCGPIIKDNKVIAAGPTTSSRMNIYTPLLINKYEIRAIIGKGGMDIPVVNALKGKAVYLSAIGGAAILYADKIKVKNTYKKDFGMTDAIWEFEVKDFPAVVTIDSKGNNLHEEIYNKSKDIFLKLIKHRVSKP